MLFRNSLGSIFWILLITYSLAQEEAFFEDSELMKYLKEVQFDAKLHKEQMKKEISIHPCPELRRQVTEVKGKEEYISLIKF